MQWICCQNGLRPDAFPHEEIEIPAEMRDGRVWRDRRILYTFRTSHFDCKEPTNYWYCIKDTPLEISTMKAKRRYEITKGNRNFEVRCLYGADFEAYGDQLYSTYYDSLDGYPAFQRRPVSREEFETFLQGCRREPDRCRFFAAFSRETGQVCGYADVYENGRYVPISSMKTRVQCEKDNVNFALVYGIVSYYEKQLSRGEIYLCDGARNIYHQTNFQGFLEKYFGFRKAYCHLHIRFRPGFAFLVRCAYPFRNWLLKWDNNAAARKVHAVLIMEHLRRGR